jgi:hypothetical protein
VQLCIVHMVRNSVKYVSYKDLKEVTTDLKKIYRLFRISWGNYANTLYPLRSRNKSL